MSIASEIARLQNAKANIKTAIENKGVTVGDIKLDAYSAKIDEISTGVEPTGTLEITENGTYDVKQKAYAKVAVPEPSGNIRITENGFHIIKQYSIAEVAVYPTLIAKTISANGTYNASDDNAYGYGSVSVNVPEKNLGTKTINANGDYNATDDNLDGYSNVSVSVPEKTLTTKTITANGTYNATDDNFDGYSQVTVETEKYAPRYITFQNYKGTELDYEINNLDPKNLTSTRYMFYYCSNLISVPLFDTSNITNMSGMFQACTSLISVPLFDTSNVTNMQEMFGYCPKLASIPLFDTSKATNMNRTFGQCNSLTEIPLFDTRSATNMQQLFYDCRKLKEIPALNTSNVTNVSEMFMACSNITTIPQLDFSSVNNVSDIFGYTSSVTNLGGFLNLGNAYDPNKSANYRYYTLDLSNQSRITHDSLMNVINNLYDIANKGVKPQQLVLGSTNLAKLTAEEIQIATDKGFEIS